MRKFNIKEIAMAISNAIRDFLPPELVEEIGDSDPLAFIINGLRETVVTVEQHERRLRAHDRSTDAIFERIEDLE
ncbi:hypothetical protein GWN75_31200, partial [candidate division KSB1 bacterium]|nr:hypothetical protein [Candidatus Saccharibacteria bacterium]NIR52940.1 hypothetical protein [candidate division KSB1 bacterium]NIV69145.1 hypothetical protein [Phycisphaerae bacterium]NIS28206.1 hypothetical protein [candidate division KSB1 bacterium]NIU28882.1 hypothetical protein [candidate division KSB1 bacterium]